MAIWKRSSCLSSLQSIVVLDTILASWKRNIRKVVISIHDDEDLLLRMVSDAVHWRILFSQAFIAMSTGQEKNHLKY